MIRLTSSSELNLVSFIVVLIGSIPNSRIFHRLLEDTLLDGVSFYYIFCFLSSSDCIYYNDDAVDAQRIEKRYHENDALLYKYTLSTGY